MNRKFLRICALAVMITLLTSSLPVFGANAYEVVDSNYTDTVALSDNAYPYRTGDLGFMEEDNESPVISTAEDYYEYTSNGYINKNNVVAIGSSELPEAVDNSQSPYFPPIGDQGGLGACVVFATTYYQFTYAMNKMRGVPTNEDNTFSVKWVYNLVNHGSDNGSSAYSIYKVLKQHGCPTAKALPYDDVDFKGWSTDPAVWREAMRYRLSDSQTFKPFGEEGTEITSNDDTDLIAVKTALNNGDVLKFSSYIYSWEYGKLKANENVPENDKYLDEQYVRLVSGYEGGHGMVIVGYNDNIWCDINENNVVDDGEMGALKIANSWSEGYGNKGFMWVAYDALNKVSCVSGVTHIDKRAKGMDEIYRIDVCEPYEGNDIYLKFTLNTADRSQFTVSVVADKNGSDYKGYFLSSAGYTMPNNKYAFDGTKIACDATFVYPLNDMDPEISAENFEQYNFNVVIKDKTKDSVPLIVKNMSIVNEHTNTEYKLNANYPITLDGSEFTSVIKESSKQNAVIYYIGYDNPTLHCKTKNGDFVSVKMEENSERHGALYKSVIYDITEDVPLYFSSEDGSKDDNQGKYYTAKEGLNFFYTKGVRPILTLHDFDLSNGTPDVAKRCLLTTEVSGGYETYKYKYTIENLNTGELKVFDFDYNYELSPYSFTSEGTYRITVEVMDYAKETASLTKEFDVIDHPFQIESLTSDKSTILVSKPVQFSSVTAFEGIASYGNYKVESQFVIKDSSGKVWCDEIVKYTTYDMKIKTTTTNYSFIPAKSGEYTLTVSSDDCNKEYAEKTISFTVYDMRVGDANGDGTVNIKDATDIQKYLASLITEEDIYKEMSDCDENANISIKDATAIQCYVAGIENFGITGSVIEYIPPTEPATNPETEPVTTPQTEPTEPTTAPVISNEVTFTNSHSWGGTIYCYYWSNDNTTMTSWPGKVMTNAGQNGFSQTLYTFEVPLEATYIIFTNGSEQTVDINYGGGEIRYYPLTTKTGNGYNVETW